MDQASSIRARTVGPPPPLSATPLHRSGDTHMLALPTLEAAPTCALALSVRNYYPPTGERLCGSAAQAQQGASRLPAACAVALIRTNALDNDVTILDGETGSGKSTQTPPNLLEMQSEHIPPGLVLHVCPLIEPLRALHRRLECEMKAPASTSLTTGRSSISVRGSNCA